MEFRKHTIVVLAFGNSALSFIHHCHGYSNEVEAQNEMIRNLRDDMDDLKSVVRQLAKQNIEYAEKIQNIESIVKQCYCPERNETPVNGDDFDKKISKSILGNISALESPDGDRDTKMMERTMEDSSSIRQTRLLTGSTSPKTAFYVTLQHDLLHHSGSTVVKFPRVITNVGNAYSPHTGIFTAIKPGTFAFSIRFTVPGHSSGYLSVVKNSDTLISVGEDGRAQFEVISGTVVVQLNSHDSVYVKTIGTTESSLVHNGTSFTTFSGWEI